MELHYYSKNKELILFLVRDIYGGVDRPAIYCLVAGWEMGEDTQNAKFLCFG